MFNFFFVIFDYEIFTAKVIILVIALFEANPELEKEYVIVFDLLFFVLARFIHRCGCCITEIGIR